MKDPILKVNGLKKYYPIKGGLFNKVEGYVRAVEDVSFQIREKETLALVGESGCGKSTTGRSVLRLEEPDGGDVIFQEQNLLTLTPEEMRDRRKSMQMIFQNPYNSLNPRMKVSSLLGEPLRTHYSLSAQEIKERIADIMEKVGLPHRYSNRYPHQFSGGQRQRISIARALILNPKVVIADEPASALDVSIQSQILNLLMELQDKLDLTFLFISHDLNVVRHISSRIGVMYLGRIVETGDTDDIFRNPRHPYTKALLSAVPRFSSERKKGRLLLKGDVPSPINPPAGCHFHPRCPYAVDRCREETPRALASGESNGVSCFLFG